MKNTLDLKYIKSYYDSHGLKEYVTTPRQLKNGTLMFMDTMIPKARIMYTFHKSGYFRRRIFTKNIYSGCWVDAAHYQLNRTKLSKSNYGNFYNTNRILVKNIATQMELALSAIMKYRKNNS